MTMKTVLPIGYIHSSKRVTTLIEIEAEVKRKRYIETSAFWIDFPFPFIQFSSGISKGLWNLY